MSFFSRFFHRYFLTILPFAIGLSIAASRGGEAGEKDSEQQGTCKGSGFLDNLQKSSSRESWQDMPQVKGLKELKLPVGGEMFKERVRGFKG